MTTTATQPESATAARRGPTTFHRDNHTNEAAAPTTHSRLLAWVAEVVELTQPDAVH